MPRVIRNTFISMLFAVLPLSSWADSKPPRLQYHCWGKQSWSDVGGELTVTNAGFVLDNLSSLYNAFAFPRTAGDDGVRQIQLYLLAGFGKATKWQKRPRLRICLLDASFSTSGENDRTSHSLAELRGGQDLCPLSLEYGKSIVVRISDFLISDGNQPSLNVCEITFLGLQN